MAGRFTPRTPTLRTPTPRPAGQTRVWVTRRGPLDLPLTLGPLRRGPGDPTYRTTPDGAVWRTSRTPAGPATLRVTAVKDTAHAEAWGAGAEWMLEQLPAMLGELDDPEAFEPRHRLLAETHRNRPGLRLTRTGLVLESLIPSVLEQKVTATEAYRAWRLLVRGFGEPAPGAPEGMYVMPDARQWAMIPSWEWHRAGVDSKRSDTVMRAVRVARRMEEAAGMEQTQAAERLRLIPGIGPWTAAETLQRAIGAPDLVTVGDLHLPGIIGHALAGNRDADDEEMLALLEPYAGQRHRAARLILLSGRIPPRRAPRFQPNNIARL
ncbi:DNA-3-methyladenine glycosylase 2 family protein [Streptomyces sp. ASQP_92]|uniref:DNA-3-methyladenine glycosylase family protein n=1 Tax=Streptomyces sp. ASQP_92 TaxID=2979116 RepID=UPI0021BE9D50|nr:DNA-3-methyladenine glycosylase 2 family protein [Streptomyces sp. ASQP_92]MCT9091829.1 DNA-3-methyladenine glycosylase 2 family protein [Streptomyces sp. ASQP_92]